MQFSRGGLTNWPRSVLRFTLITAAEIDVKMTLVFTQGRLYDAAKY